MSVVDKLKPVAHRFALRAEVIVDHVFGRTGKGRIAQPYAGYAAPDALVVRGRVLSAVRGAKPTEGQSKLKNLAQMISLFLTDEVAGVTVKTDAASTESDEEGYFTIRHPRGEETGWVTIPVHVEGAEAPVDCDVMIPSADARMMVISDIDDTVMQTGAYSLARNLWTSMTGNVMTREIFSDAIDLLDRLAEKGRNPVYFVSSSPWNLYDFLRAVFDRAGVVKGPMFLRDLGLSETKFITEGHGNHKLGSIQTLLAANPDLPAILIGDTGQKDAKIYAEAVRENPGRIRAVVLRAPGPGLDTEDHADLDALKALDVPVYSGKSFDGFAADILADTTADDARVAAE